MQQKDYWDSVSDNKEFTTPFQREAFARYVSQGALVVDVGCGYGRTLQELKEAGFRRLMGFDFSVAMIRRGLRQHPGLDLRVMGSPRLELEDGSVDAVILFAVLTCICRNEEQQALIAEISRVLRPGGILYVNDFLLNDDARNKERYERFAPLLGVYGAFELPEGAIVRHHDPAWIAELLGGFGRQEYGTVTFTTMNGHKSNGFFFIGKKPQC